MNYKQEYTELKKAMDSIWFPFFMEVQDACLEPTESYKIKQIVLKYRAKISEELK